MLKFLFWLLLLANAILFAYHQGHLDKLFSNNHEPARLGRQLHPDRIKVLPPAGAAASAPPAATVQPVAAAASAASTALTASASATAAASAAAPAACVEIGTFDAAEARRIAPRLAALLPADRIAQRQVQDTPRHIVAIPPLGSKELAETKAGQLRRMGVTDFYIIQDGSAMQWAISLGIFKSEETAKAHLADLAQKGVRSAKLLPFPGLSRVAFQLRNPDDKVKSGLDKLKADFPNQDVHACPAA